MMMRTSLLNDAVLRLSETVDESISNIGHSSGRSIMSELALSKPSTAEPQNVDLAEIERLVTQAWQRVVGKGALNPNVNYNELGRGFARALIIIGEIKRLTGVELPANIFSWAPTITQMARVVAGLDHPIYSPIVTIKEGDGGPGLFLVPGAGGIAMDLYPLANHLDFAGAVHAIETRGLDGRIPTFPTVDEAADEAAAAIRACQPQGPYFLGSYSFGGCVAIETARRLHESGQEVSFLGLIEPSLNDRVWPWHIWATFLARRIFQKAHINRQRAAFELRKGRAEPKRAAEETAKPPASNPLRRLFDRIIRVLQPFKRVIHRFMPPGTDASKFSSPYYQGGLPPLYQNVRDQTIAAYCRYKPKKLGIKTVFFETEEGDMLTCDPHGLWPRILTDLEWCQVTGDHATVVRVPHVHILADQFSIRLAAARNAMKGSQNPSMIGAR